MDPVPTTGLDESSSKLSFEIQTECTLRPRNFFSLPLELREEIYMLLLTKPQNTITMLSNHACHRSEISALQPPLAFVNRRLRHETLCTFYASNLFMADVSTHEDLVTAQRWVDAIGEGNVGRLRKMALCGWTKVPFGHMVARQWVRVVLDLQRGVMEVEGDEQHARIARSVEELKQGFEGMIGALQEKAVDGKVVKIVLEGFHQLCVIW